MRIYHLKWSIDNSSQYGISVSSVILSNKIVSTLHFSTKEDAEKKQEELRKAANELRIIHLFSSNIEESELL